MKRKTAQPGFLVLAIATAALILGLHQLGNIEGLRFDWSDPIGWLNNAAAEDAVGALLRSTGLVIGYWIMAGTVLYAAATIHNPSGSGRLLTLTTLPGVRRVVDRALATALAATIAASPLTPALAAEQPPPAVVFDINTDGVPVPHVRLRDETSVDDQPTATVELIPGAEPTAAAGTPQVFTRSQATPSAATATTHTVESGDNLWSIADNQLQATAGTEPTTATIIEYWRRLIETNRTTLRSGDPNLIYPGELVALPPLEVSK